MEHFLEALLERPIRYEFPRLWYTKGETLARYVAIDGNGRVAVYQVLLAAPIDGVPSGDRGAIAVSVLHAC